MTMSIPRPQSMRMTREEAEALTAGKWYGQQRDVIFYGASIDSRLVRPGNLFCCIEGARVDGHDYAEIAVGDGAACILAQRYVEAPAPVLVVEDVALAMAAIARVFRQRYTGARWLAVTGSNGKTTVKEMLRVLCGKHARVHCTQGNYNNHLGVPLTVLATPANCAFVITELGASAVHEIETLARIVQPHCALITSVGPAHLEGFGGLAGVARAKSEIFAALVASAPDTPTTALFSLHGLEHHTPRYGSSHEEIVGIIHESIQGNAAITETICIGDNAHPLTGVDSDTGQHIDTPAGSVHIPCFGRHNISNALLAWHAAVSQGIDGVQACAALADVRPVAGRLNVKIIGGHRLYDDSYNANPGSMQSGLYVLSQQAGARLAILGQMGELGADSVQLHESVGAEAARLGLPLLSVGEHAQAIGVGFTAAGGRNYEHAPDHAAAVRIIMQRLSVGPHALLIKASRSAGLEQVVEAVLENIEETVESTVAGTVAGTAE